MMNNTINGKTPEEIKWGLECCILETDDTALIDHCRACLYRATGLCFRHLLEDALAYIQQLEDHFRDLAKMVQQLERERDEARNDLDALNYANTELHSAYEAMKRERDAAVEALTKIANETGSCTGCVHYTKPGFKCYLWEANENCYEWRGVQEVEE